MAVALVLTGFAGVRVFRPADTVDLAHGPYPPADAVEPTFYGEQLRAPLFVAGRIRVYAAANRVFADGPVDTKMTASAYWALRRWPAQLVGLAVAGDRIVVSQWSDGVVIGQRPDTGAIVWRADGGTRTHVYEGRRTGARTVYDPPDLLTADTSSGPVVLARGGSTITALDGETGKVLWRAPTSGCANVFTGPGIVVSTGCSTVDVRDAATGRAGPTWPDLRGATRPVGCAVGRSRCTGLAGNGVPGWTIGPDGTLAPASGLSTVDSWLAGSTVVRVDDGEVSAYDAATGTRRWERPMPGAVVLAVEPDVVHLLVHHDVVTLDLDAGTTRSAVYAHVPQTNDVPWNAGYAYAERGYVVIERVMPGVPSSAPDDAYYYTSPPLVLTGS